MQRSTFINCVSGIAIALMPFAGHAQKKPKPVPYPPGAYAQTAPVSAGTIARVMLNPMGEVDGFLLSDGIQVKFPPHMSDELVAVVAIGDPVNIQGFNEYSGTVKAFAITNTKSGQTVVEHPPEPNRLPPHLRGAALREMSAQGRVSKVLTGPKADPNGVLLEDGSIVRFPPHIGFQFAQFLQPGQVLVARGYGTQNQYGRALEATAMGPSASALQPFYNVGAPR